VKLPFKAAATQTSGVAPGGLSHSNAPAPISTQSFETLRGRGVSYRRSGSACPRWRIEFQQSACLTQLLLLLARFIAVCCGQDVFPMAGVVYLLDNIGSHHLSVPFDSPDSPEKPVSSRRASQKDGSLPAILLPSHHVCYFK
jgi:hypothetical protein